MKELELELTKKELKIQELTTQVNDMQISGISVEKQIILETTEHKEVE